MTTKGEKSGCLHVQVLNTSTSGPWAACPARYSLNLSTCFSGEEYALTTCGIRGFFFVP
jgi:hypothetical protein